MLLLAAWYRGNSGVEPCFLMVCNDLSFELARLLELCFSVGSTRFCSEEFSLWEDLDAIKFEKKDFEGSRPCWVGLGEDGEGGSSGMAVMRGDGVAA